MNLLLTKLKTKQKELSLLYGYKPIFLKLSPDERVESLKEICKSIVENNIDGIICSNTTIDHEDKNSPGGLSGAPLMQKSTKALSFIKTLVDKDTVIIASGGVMSRADFQEKIDAGADLVQLYTGFIYEGPKLIREIILANSK